MLRRLLSAATFTLCASATAAEPVWLGRFDAGTAGWLDVRLSKNLTPTRYTAKVWDGVAAIEARAESSMSLFARPVEVDLAATPVLCWRWRVDAPLQRADLTRKDGDDYAARVYVSFKLPPERLGWATRTQLKLARAIWGDVVPDAAINYVWDNRHPVGTVRPNAYTDRTLMHVLQSGAAQAGRWVGERRDLAADVATSFGAGARMAQLAIASDTDNTGESARAGFADFHLVARDAACAFPP